MCLHTRKIHASTAARLNSLLAVRGIVHNNARVLFMSILRPLVAEVRLPLSVPWRLAVSVTHDESVEEEEHEAMVFQVKPKLIWNGLVQALLLRLCVQQHWWL